LYVVKGEREESTYAAVGTGLELLLRAVEVPLDEAREGHIVGALTTALGGGGGGSGGSGGGRHAGGEYIYIEKERDVMVYYWLVDELRLFASDWFFLAGDFVDVGGG
jgi:hypothetical protein